VREGQPVKLKFAAFPFQKYGLAQGVVEHVGADATESQGAAETERRIESVNAECIRLSRKLAATAIGDSGAEHADGFYEGLLWALRKMRDGQ
jgi:hypothetical protein